MIKRAVSSAKARSRFLFNKNAAKAMIETIKEMDVRSDGKSEVSGVNYRSVVLGEKVKMLGESPTQFEKQIFAGVVREKGLEADDVRVVLDVAARYLHPHISVGYQTMKWPLSQRGYFHPQHYSYAQEDSQFSDKTKAALKEQFTPQEGWNVLDIGAYLGLGSLKLAQLVGESGKVISVEAKKENFELLKHHAEENGASVIHPVFGAIWKEAGVEMNFNTTKRQANALDKEVISGNARGVQTVSIPHLAAMVSGPVHLVSLTVTGAEVEAIEGLQGLGRVDLPERILAPGWYKKGKEPRSVFLKESLQKLGYRVEVTQKGMVFAWFD